MGNVTDAIGAMSEGERSGLKAVADELAKRACRRRNEGSEPVYGLFGLLFERRT